MIWFMNRNPDVALNFRFNQSIGTPGFWSNPSPLAIPQEEKDLRNPDTIKSAGQSREYGIQAPMRI
jgi:hypothetical protein